MLTNLYFMCFVVNDQNKTQMASWCRDSLTILYPEILVSSYFSIWLPVLDMLVYFEVHSFVNSDVFQEILYFVLSLNVLCIGAAYCLYRNFTSFALKGQCHEKFCLWFFK